MRITQGKKLKKVDLDKRAMFLAMEYGYLMCERGWNIQKTRQKFLELVHEGKSLKGSK